MLAWTYLWIKVPTSSDSCTHKHDSFIIGYMVIGYMWQRDSVFTMCDCPLGHRPSWIQINWHVFIYVSYQWNKQWLIMYSFIGVTRVRGGSGRMRNELLTLSLKFASPLKVIHLLIVIQLYYRCNYNMYIVRIS